MPRQTIFFEFSELQPVISALFEIKNLKRCCLNLYQVDRFVTLEQFSKDTRSKLLTSSNLTGNALRERTVVIHVICEFAIVS